MTYPTGLVFDADASQFSGLADGTVLTSLIDSVSGNAGTSSGAVTKQTDVHGKTFLQFNGASGDRFTWAPGDILDADAALKTPRYSIIIVAEPEMTGSSQVLLSHVTSGATGMRLFLGTDQVGDFYFNGCNTRGPKGSDAFSVICRTHSNQHASVDSTEYRASMFLNGTLKRCSVKAHVPSTEARDNFTVGSQWDGSDDVGYRFTGKFYRLMIFDNTISDLECMQATKTICDELSRPYPWADAAYILAWTGDDIVAGIGSTNGAAANDAPILASLDPALDLPDGHWTNTGWGGITATGIYNNIDLLLSWMPSFYNKPILYIGFEWYNQRGLAPEVAADATRLLVSSLKALPNTKVIIGTTTDASPASINDATQIERDAYNASIVADNGGADATWLLHNNVDIGVSGAYEANTSLWYDTVRLNGDGYAILAADAVPYITAISFSSVVPEIAAVSEFRLNLTNDATFTVTTTEAYQTGATIEIDSVPVATTETSSTELTASIPRGMIGETFSITVTDSVGTSGPVIATILAPTGYSYATAAIDYANVTLESFVYDTSQYSGVVATDQILVSSLTTGGRVATVDENIVITVGTSLDGTTVPALTIGQTDTVSTYVLDASDGLFGSETVLTITYPGNVGFRTPAVYNSSGVLRANETNTRFIARADIGESAAPLIDKSTISSDNSGIFEIADVYIGDIGDTFDAEFIFSDGESIIALNQTAIDLDV